MSDPAKAWAEGPIIDESMTETFEQHGSGTGIPPWVTPDQAKTLLGLIDGDEDEEEE